MRTMPPRFSPAHAISRRRLILGTASAAAAAALPTPALSATPPAVLTGTQFALDIGYAMVNITGRQRLATVVNGQLPAPILRWREGDVVTLAVTNRLAEPTSIHWHGIRTPAEMDGVPGLSFPGIAPGETFTYRFAVPQHGTYWYHSHSGFQEQTGHYGALVVDPRDGYAQGFDRDYVVLLSDWSDEHPGAILSNLKAQPDYYNRRQRTAEDFAADIRRTGLRDTLADRLAWGEMRMNPTDILDVSGATYTYLINGQPPGANWTALFRPGERVRLRIINGSAMSIFDVRIPGLSMTVVQADGNDVAPVEVDEFRIGTAETYDVIVTPREDRAYTIFAQAADRSLYARGTLAPRAGMAGVIPPMDPAPLRTMADMGMDHGAHGGAAAGAQETASHAEAAGAQATAPAMGGHGAHAPRQEAGHAGHGAMSGASAAALSAGNSAARPLRLGVSVDNIAAQPISRISDPGFGLGLNGRRALRYTDLRALYAGTDQRPPGREIVLRLTGNMNRFIWGFDGRKYSEAEPIHLRLNERVRFVVINDTMMEHPIHLHGLWSELENGQGAFRPYKHTVLVKPAERITWLATADLPGRWAFHCHLLFHMDTGMFREVHVS